MNIIEQLSAINQTLGQIQSALANPPFWQSNIFAAMIGFSGGLLVFILDRLSKNLRARNEELSGIYQWLLGQLAFDTPEALVQSARSTSYANITIRNGQRIEHPDRLFAEKMVLGLKRHIKYWTYPKYSKIKRLFKKYEHVISKFPEWNSPNINEHLDKAQGIYNQIEQYVYDQTGESRFTS